VSELSEWKEVQEIAYTKKDNRHLPFFSSWVWRTALAVIFILGLSLGVGLAIYLLQLRGLW
jgi:hypothetical protein